MNVKLNDNVLVITGKYAGKQGKVVATSPKSGTVVVEGVNIHKKSQKARKANEVSKIVEKEAPIDVSNVMVVCPSCDKAVRIKYNVEGKENTEFAPSAAQCLTRLIPARAERLPRRKSRRSA